MTGIEIARAAKTISRGVKVWTAVKPVRRAQKVIRTARNKRRERLGKPLLDVNFPDDKEFGMKLKGKLSWTGLGVIGVGLVLSMFGVGECSPADLECVPPEAIAEQIVSAIDKLLIAVGMVISARGRSRQAVVVYKDEISPEKR